MSEFVPGYSFHIYPNATALLRHSLDVKWSAHKILFPCSLYDHEAKVPLPIEMFPVLFDKIIIKLEHNISVFSSLEGQF